jgi:hypothetical protein
MKTIRDAEIKCRQLEIEISSLRAEIRRTNEDIDRTPVQNNQLSQHTETRVENTDSQVVADGSTVLHKLLHIFSKLKASELDIDNLTVNQDASIGDDLTVGDNLTVTGDITVGDDLTVTDKITARSLNLLNGGGAQQIHVSIDASNEGFYVMALGNDTLMLSGAYHNGANYIAVNTTAIILHMTAFLGFILYYNTGLTVGNAFTPTVRCILNANMTIPGLAAGCAVFTGTGGLLEAANMTLSRTYLDVYSKAEVNTLLAGKASTGSKTLAINTVANHTHGGAVVADGGHTHTGTVTI